MSLSEGRGWETPSWGAAGFVQEALPLAAGSEMSLHPREKRWMCHSSASGR